MPRLQLDPPLDALDHVAGAPDAELVLLMYGDFQCPYCAAAQPIVRRVRERLDGRLRLAFRHMPIVETHPDAQAAAEASEAAAAQGRFWDYHDALYAARGRLAPAELVEHAARLGLDAARVDRELRERAHAGRVARDADSARALGLTGTPTFFVNGELHEGAFDAGSLVDALEAPAQTA